MKIFYLQFRVMPTKENEKYDLVEGALAHCWIKETNPQNAYAKAEFFVSKSDWKITKVEEYPIEVNESNFLGKDLGTENYLKAKSDGLSIAYLGWSRDGKTTAGPFQLKQSFEFPISEYIDNQKKLSQRGRCLHYENGHRCNEIIKAHSIQKNQSLSAIAQNGHVYKISSDIGSLKENKGRLTYKKYGVNKVSTFLGFCKKHDNELFEPIDNDLLKPTDQQVLLYSYRSLCRELFVSENALELAKSQLEKGVNQEAIKNMLSGYVRGKSFGLENLKRHKSCYDKSLLNKSYSNIKYVIFQSSQKPVIAFSGLFYPDFDFLGRELQNLGDQTQDLQLITFCSTPMKNGWAYLFAWHKTSSKVCVDFIRSLATMIYNNRSSLSDHLFRLAMTNCENLAISPKWWEKLDQDIKEKIEDRGTSMADIFAVTEQSYLMEGLEGISDWEFEN
ncbi:MAG: hypothetical protein EHM34_03795, partial [Nitrosopumilales archaeon]